MGQRRRLSQQGRGVVERSLQPEMVAHIVDALYDKCALAASVASRHFFLFKYSARLNINNGIASVIMNKDDFCGSRSLFLHC